MIMVFVVVRLIESMKVAFKHNYYSGVLIISSIMMAMHYVTIPKCPIVVASGPSETGKTTSLMIALSLIGKQHMRHNF